MSLDSSYHYLVFRLNGIELSPVNKPPYTLNNNYGMTFKTYSFPLYPKPSWCDTSHTLPTVDARGWGTAQAGADPGQALGSITATVLVGLGKGDCSEGLEGLDLQSGSTIIKVVTWVKSPDPLKGLPSSA